jgi:plastocyanin
MNRAWQLAVSLAFIFAVSVASSAEENDGTTQSEAKPTSVEMKSISYDPKSVEVPVGGFIVWTNKAFTNHTATSEDEGRTFDTGEIEPNESSNQMNLLH